MWQAKAMAHPTVSRSPAASERPSPTVSIASPTKASNTPTSVGILTTAGRPAIRLANAANKGVKTTYSPVIKPELEALVRASPSVWRANPAKRRTPSSDPSRHTAFVLGRANKARTTPPSRNRQAMNDIGGRTVMASLTTTKVAPRGSAAKQRANAATSGRRDPTERGA